MQELTVTQTTTAPPERVWQVLVDLDGSAEALSGVVAVERLDAGDGFGVGTRWRETRVMFGKEATEVLEVTAVDAGRSYVVEADNRGTHYRSVMSVAPAGTGSTITMTFGAEAQGRVNKLLARTMGKAFEGATRKALAQDLADIAAAAEAAVEDTEDPR